MVSYWLSQYLKSEPDKQQIINAIATFNNYASTAAALLNKRKKLHSRLSWDHKKLANEIGYTSRLDQMAKLHEENAKLFEDLTKFACNKYNVTATDLFLVKKTQSPIALLELIVRDWSDSQSHLRYVLDFFESSTTKFAQNSRILIPGAGLGRVAHELVKRGFNNVEAFDFSYLCTITTEFLAQTTAGQYKVYPYTHQFSYQVSKQAQFRQCSIPAETPEPQAKVVYGDFLEWGRASSDRYDVIITVFFIDTAEDVFIYLENMKRLLAPGGTWINIGPVKWGTAPRAELNVEELKDLMRIQGWKLANEHQATNEYFLDDQSLWRGTYGTIGWTATLEQSDEVQSIASTTL